MSYTLQAIIGSTDTLRNKVKGIVPVSLKQNMEMLVFNSELLSANKFVQLPLTDDEGKDLPDNIKEFCRFISQGCSIVYVEAEYFGGSGVQAYAHFQNGNMQQAPVRNAQAINEALRVLGLEATPPFDEFASVGLGEKRETNEWL